MNVKFDLADRDSLQRSYRSAVRAYADLSSQGNLNKMGNLAQVKSSENMVSVAKGRDD